MRSFGKWLDGNDAAAAGLRGTSHNPTEFEWGMDDQEVPMRRGQGAGLRDYRRAIASASGVFLPVEEDEEVTPVED